MPSHIVIDMLGPHTLLPPRHGSETREFSCSDPQMTRQDWPASPDEALHPK
eukprot:CAMPEP_0172591816 /NCGR_PEP_ID=MMETSP1068-20121228/10682_1 /TAXON_ID=35684 /ORGANISM="Pseudopedinella elastica, Strain CCMP716" /LENGTH=50 /DNA_ID=CAMNT_0013388497 /DNA_START=336 /DNA_END=488 /DNA_ORIENTATION=-